MGSVEAFILRGIAKRHGKERWNFKSWLEDFSRAFLDIIDGLGAPNNINDTSYHRNLIMTFLIVKLLDSDKSMSAIHSKWQELSELSDSCLPVLSYHEFFESLSFLGLGTEFASVMNIIDVDVQEVLGQQLCDWVQWKTCASEDTAIKESLNVTLFIASLLISLKMGLQNDRLLISTVKKCQELIVFATQQNESKNPCITVGVSIPTTYFNCMKLMFEVLEFNIASQKCDIASSAAVDVLYLNGLKDTLECGLTKNALHQTITNLISLNDSQTAVGNVRSSQESPYCLYVEKALDHLHRVVTNATLKEICCSLKTLLDVDVSDAEVEVGISTKTPLWENDMFVIRNCLDGYEESSIRLLTSMVKNPLGNCNWEEIMDSFQTSPQCLAVKSNLLLIVDVISHCTRLAEHDYRQVELSTIASRFQNLFWKGYVFLGVKSKYDLAKEITFCRKDYGLLSSYLMRTSECGSASTQRIGIDHKAKKAIQKFFEKVIDENALNDTVRGEFCYIWLLSPSLCLESLVENAFYNRMGLFASLLFEWDYVLQFPYVDNQPCLFWSKFFDCMKYQFLKEDGKSVDNGMALITSLFEKSLDESIHFQSLIKEGFATFGRSLSRDCQSDPVTEKLHLLVIQVFSNSELLRKIMSPEELLSVCVTLCTKIDISVSSWHPDPSYNVDSELIDVFEAVLTIASEQIEHLNEQNHDEFVLITTWLSHILKGFTWLTRLRFLSVLQQIDGFLLSVPACLTDVCELPAIFRPDVDLCYGKGNGLLAWLQCFVINSNMCPVNSLAIGTLKPSEIKMFTNAWNITLAQFLPFCKTPHWLKLMETTKLLISDCRLYCPYECTHIASLPNISTSEVYNLLGVVQVIKGVFAILCNKQLHDWCSKLNFVSLSKHFSEVCSWLVSVSPDFAKASPLSQAFILSQMFCSVCYVARLMQNVGNTQVQACINTFFILCLELLGTFEKLVLKLCSEKNSDGDSETSDDVSDSLSYYSSGHSASFTTKYQIMELSSRIEEMLQSSSIMREEQNEILIRKLHTLKKGMDEIGSCTTTDLDQDSTV